MALQNLMTQFTTATAWKAYATATAATTASTDAPTGTFIVAVAIMTSGTLGVTKIGDDADTIPAGPDGLILPLAAKAITGGTATNLVVVFGR